MFMSAIAHVVGVYSWPCIFRGAYFAFLRRFHLLFQHVFARDEQARRATAWVAILNVIHRNIIYLRESAKLVLIENRLPAPAVIS